MKIKKKNHIVEVEELTVGYDNKVILENINFTVREGEIFGILGGSGCGKSTLLKHIIGLYRPMHGEILIDGHQVDPTPDGRKRIAPHIGVTYQGGALLGSLTLGENIALPLEEYTDKSPEEIRQIVKEKLEMVDLDGYEDYLPAELSGGMKKRAGVARAMALDPSILFFDEPSAGLDPISSVELDRLLMCLRDKFDTTVVIVTHELDSVFAITDRVIMLSKEEKTAVAIGDPRKLKVESKNQWIKCFLNREI